MTQEDPSGTVEITRMSLRDGGWIGYGDDAVYVDRGDDRVKIHADAVTQVGLRTIEWDLAVMSLLLVAVGGYVAATRNPLIGAGFAAAGAFSLYRTYRKRYELAIGVRDRAKPVTVYPAHPGECRERLVDRLGLQ